MSSDTYRYWATNRGWISTKFAVRNPVSHFLNVYKKKDHQNNSSVKNNQNQFGFSKQIQNKIQKRIDFKQSKLLTQTPISKPKTAPNKFKIIVADIEQKQIQRKIKTLHPKRNRSLPMKKTKALDIEINELSNLSAVMAKIKQDNQANSYSQRNFRATNCGRYKPQMMFLKPKMRTSTASVKIDKSKINQALQQRKANIYKQINKSLDVDTKICSVEQYKRTTSMNNYQPIQYMTQYGEVSEQQMYLGQNEENIYNKSPLNTKIMKRKPNIAVLRNKLNLQYRKSGYRQKMHNLSMQPQEPSQQISVWDN